ncbi:acetolactate synthase 2 catalytic subunit [Porticoccus sp. W117]|uniref:acetolactate synthase 2 catalytic subunit n=1 Tax=Porticoccus sp. W117 TaxID=3054777 RepID=UPI0025967B2D|nr:acetolactate synthase 2 catalytic subunit [Porticoccus sp. W117]MDM3872247.1 acetolactate synthase 2 catalytic subunit [Porticoccus sp. W117]
MTGSELILKVLEKHEVKRVFGYPGGAIMPLYDALYDSPVEHHLFRHEQGAGFAAVGYARATGKVGVCFATSGPGATNLITSLADAMLDSVPIVAITGQVATNVQGTDAFQEADVLGLSLAVTKHSYLVKDASELESALQDAFAVAQDGRPGPVVVDISKDVQLAEIDMAALVQPVEKPVEKERPTAVDSEAVVAARHLLAEAKQPILYVGGGAGMADAVAELRAFQNATDIPAVSTLKGLGTLDPENKNSLHLLGMHGNRAANLAVHECDLLIAVGARFDDRVTGKLDTFAPDAKVIHLDVDRAETNKLRRANVAIHDDLKAVLPQLHLALDIEPWREHCQRLKTAYAWRYDFDKEGIYAPAVLKKLSDRMPKNSVVCCDVGQHQMWVAQHMMFDDPKNHLTSGGLGTMGFGLPVAIGAKFSRPEDFVVAVSGDGSFMMNVQELQTIKRYQVPVKILLIDNQRLGMVRQWQQLFFESRYSETNLSDNPDFVALAAVFGIPGRTITLGSEVDAALEEFIQTDGPYMLHVCINADDNVWPLVPPGKSNKDMLEEV